MLSWKTLLYVKAATTMTTIKIPKNNFKIKTGTSTNPESFTIKSNWLLK